MSLNSTLKKNGRFRRKTAKSGGAKTKSKTAKLSKNAEEWVPPKPKSPNAVNNIAARMAATSITTESSADFMTFLALQYARLTERIENAVAIDCEMVGMKPDNKSALAHVAIVDFNGKKLLDKYVIPTGGIEQIKDYRTPYSGIKPSTLAHLDKSKHSYEIVKKEVDKILEGKTIVGHGLTNDFIVLEYTPVEGMVWDSTLIDNYLQTNPYTGARQPRKLKAIAKEFADNNIQRADRTGHSPLEDARASMNLYRLSFGYAKVPYANMSK